MRLAITLLIQEFFRPRREDPLGFLAPHAPVLTQAETYELLDQMDGDLFRAVRANVGNGPRNTQETFEHLAPRRRQPKRRWLR